MAGFDALLPAEIAKRAETVGVTKAGLPALSLFVLGALAGAFIALGAVFYTVTITGGAGVVPFGLLRVLGGITFSLGLILVVVGGAELFTGNNLIVMAWAGRRVTTVQLLRNWGIVYLGNAVGAVGTAVMVWLAGQDSMHDGAFQDVALRIAKLKLNVGFVEAVARGVLCNALVCLAVWLSFSARSTADRVLAVVPPVTAFVACGFEHCIANLYFVPYAMLSSGGIDLGTFVVRNLIPVTLGNILGGGGLVGLVYWFVYLRPSARR